MLLAEFIKERREAKGFSKRKLAHIAAISHTEVHRIENGERNQPSLKVLSKLANALEVSYEDMLHAAGCMVEHRKGFYC